MTAFEIVSLVFLLGIWTCVGSSMVSNKKMVGLLENLNRHLAQPGETKQTE